MNHQFYMQRCLQIAKNGIGSSRPNPSVGAVIVYRNQIIGEGFTSPYGGRHAEVNAIESVKDLTLLKEATVYVTLEPCAHYGKTPPCADLLIKHQVKNVVIGCVDSNSLVAGKGIARLNNAGIYVIVGVLEAACKKHHRRFFTVQNKKRPYVILKWAQTKDGFIAPETKKEQQPVWISNSFSKQLVHKLRSQEHAILVGVNTVLADNPQLNVRTWSGENPVRIILDPKAKTPKNSHVFDGSIKTIFIVDRLCHSEKQQQIPHNNHVFTESIDYAKEVAIQICEVLQKHQIQSVIIEGGAKTIQTFVDANIWDEAMVYVGHVIFNKGIKAPILNAVLKAEKMIGQDILKTYIND